MPYAVVPYADYADVGPNKYGVITPSDEQRADPLFYMLRYFCITSWLNSREKVSIKVLFFSSIHVNNPLLLSWQRI